MHGNTALAGATIQPQQQQSMRRMLVFLLILAAIQLAAWLLPTWPEFKGIPYYLALHEVLEVSSIVFSMMIFAVGWNTKDRALPGNVVLLASVYVWIGVLDFLHTMNYGGMPEFLSPNDAQKHLNFWLSARFSTAIALLLVSIRPWTSTATASIRYGAFGIMGTVTAVISWIVFYHQSWLPDTFIVGQGLTPFKKNTEYLVMVIHLITGAFFLRQFRNGKGMNVVLLFGAVCTLSMSEFFFTLYTTMTGSYNVLGHIYKVIADILIYRAIVVQVIEQPLTLVQRAQEKLRTIFNSVNDGIELISLDGRIVDMNQIDYQRMGYKKEEVFGESIEKFAPQAHAADFIKRLGQIDEEKSTTFETTRIRKDGVEIPVEISARRVYLDGESLILGVSRDISERREWEAALRQSKQQYDRLVTNIPVGVFLLHTTSDGAFTFRYVSPRFCSILDITRDIRLLDYTAVTAAIHPEDVASFHTANKTSIDNQTPFEWLGRTSVRGETRWIHIESLPENLEQGECLWNGIVSDVTDKVLAEERLRIVGKIFDVTQEAIMVTDVDNIIIDVNAAFTRITGYRREEALGQPPRLLSSGRHDRDFYARMWKSINEEKAWRGEIWNRSKLGNVYPEILSISAICDKQGNTQYYVAVFSDISHIKEHEARLTQAAHYDALTGIPNRTLLGDRMRQAIAHGERNSTLVAVCYLDLDGFKAINDEAGHEGGDIVLVEVAQRLNRCLRSGDTVARLGGDEFVVLLQGIKESSECLAMVERMLDAVCQPIAVDKHTYRPTVSIGVSIYPIDDEAPDTLLRHADQAMYTAKQSGKNQFHIFDHSLDLKARAQNDMLKSIQRGLQTSQFVLHYQPKVDLRSKAMLGAEALIRWQHPDHGLLSPAAFLPRIVNNPLDIELGKWVIATALSQLDAWTRSGCDLQISINISSQHLESPDFIENLRTEMARYPAIPRGKLQIEVLETVALMNIDQVKRLIDECHAIGVDFALDDFGTGFSSLAYLSKLPFDTVKIDQTFVRDLATDSKDRSIIQGIIKLSEVFELETVAEGIETPEQYAQLMSMGCKLGQGYFIARPMPADALISWAQQAGSV